MSINKLEEKTKRVINKQQELSELIDDLKIDVKDVYYQNQKLLEENENLKKELAHFNLNEPEKEVEDSSIDEIINPVEEIKKDEIVMKEEKPVQAKNEKSEKIKARNSAFIEFFLGKNVIAKIAAVLIFLGVVSFGQIAYVELSDFGRVLLIFFGGIVFGGIAWYSEKKESVVFSSVFYGISVFIMFYSFVLARFEFELIGNSVMSYLSITLMVASLGYFWNRRYDFLDILLLLFYIVVGMSIVSYIEHPNSFSTYIELILFTSLLGYTVYLYLTKYFVDKENHRMIAVTMFGLAISYLLLILTFLIFEESSFGMLSFMSIVYIILAVYFVYISNIFNKIQYYSKIIFIVPIISMITILASSSALYGAFYSLNIVDHSSFIIISFVLLAIPLNIYKYLEKDRNYDEVSTFYVMAIAIALFVYSFVAGSFGSGDAFEYYLLNIILGIDIIAFYVLAKFTDDNRHRGIAYFFIGVFLIRNFTYYLVNNEMLFSQSNVIFVSIGVGLILLGVNLFSKYKYNRQHQIDNVIVQVVNLFVFIPFVIVFTNDLLSHDLAYILAMVMIWVIGYRWLMELDVFKLFYKKEFIAWMNVLILVLTLVINLFYFDHDFSQFSDVFKFSFMFLVNLYIINSLRELYISYGKNENVEINFLALYIIGVVIHSYFIHNYINFEFDKVILSSYFLIASAVVVLAGFRTTWVNTRKLGLGAIYFSLGKFFVYDFYTQDFSTFVRMVTYFILGFILLGISLLYAYLEKTYGNQLTE